MSNEEKVYLPPVQGGLWSISRLIEGRWIKLIQDRGVDSNDAAAVLRALHMPVTNDVLDLYFPRHPVHGRCPTLFLLELCNKLDETNPFFLKQKGEVGV